MNQLIAKIDQSQLRQDHPAFRVGDLLRADIKVVEGQSVRLQAFEGVVTRMSGGGMSEMFTLRKVSFGVGVERTLPLHSPHIQKITVIRSGKVRRAKLYYLRELSGKAARIEEKKQSVSQAAGNIQKSAPIPEEAETASAGTV